MIMMKREKKIMMSRYQAYLTILGFITNKSENKDEEWMLTEALDEIYFKSNSEEKEVEKKPLITNEILKHF